MGKRLSEREDITTENLPETESLKVKVKVYV